MRRLQTVIPVALAERSAVEGSALQCPGSEGLSSLSEVNPLTLAMRFIG